MDWDSVDERLVKRGELLLGLEFLERYEDELKAMNDGMNSTGLCVRKAAEWVEREHGKQALAMLVTTDGKHAIQYKLMLVYFYVSLGELII